MHLRPRFRVLIPDVCQDKELVLRGSHIRSNGSSEPHQCAVCLNTLKLNTKRGTPEWAQCPGCLDVVHLSCLTQWINKSTQQDKFTCPSCRASYHILDFEANENMWSADNVIDKLKEELDPSFSDEDDEDDEDDDEDEEDEDDEDDEDDEECTSL